MEVSLQLLLKALEGWSEVLEEDDLRVAATCETLAKVLANMRSPESEKYFQRAEKTRESTKKSPLLCLHRFVLNWCSLMLMEVMYIHRATSE